MLCYVITSKVVGLIVTAADPSAVNVSHVLLISLKRLWKGSPPAGGWSDIAGRWRSMSIGFDIDDFRRQNEQMRYYYRAIYRLFTITQLRWPLAGKIFTSLLNGSGYSYEGRIK